MPWNWLDQLEEMCVEHCHAKGHSPKTIAYDLDTFKHYHRCLEETGRLLDTTSLPTPVFQAFATWIRMTPTRGCRGNTKRRIGGIHGNMKDLKAFPQGSA
jgi:hypothetical protein